MSGIFNLKKNWDDNVVKFQNKVSKIYDTERKNTKYNPFLDKNGELVNPYLNYQKILDNSNVAQTAKDYIQKATGLTPTQQNEISAMPVQNNTQESSGDYKKYTDTSGVKPVVDNTSTNTNLVTAAKNYIGTPYVWGGESMSEGGMDCSGFVYSALKDAGYNVGRTTAQGYRNYGTKVDKSNMQAGDLVFFGKGDNASHIGIYLGNGQMIHSSGGSKNTKENPGKGVSITNVDYRSDFLEARRY